MEAAHQRATTTAGELTFLALLDRALAGCGSVDAVASALPPAVAERSFAIGGVLWVADRSGALETAGRFPAPGAGREPDPVFAMRVKDAGETLMESRNGSGGGGGVPLRAGGGGGGGRARWGGRGGA